ncbi:MAG: L-seryl-tRNA(Sec) selenium transferase, partial [Anaerolineae bacterium SM23_ 63]
LRSRSETWVERLGQGEVISGHSNVGGGSLPEETLPTSLLALSVRYPNAFTSHLRRADPPVIARIEDDRVMLDPRTVLMEQEEDLLRALGTILSKTR